MEWKTLALALAMSAEDVYGAPAEEKRQDSAALMRFECSKLAIERIDPLAQPGQALPANLAALSTCASCTYADGLSNYWTASLFFKAKNGSFLIVPQATNLGLKGNNGGMTVYYNNILIMERQRLLLSSPKGFRMVVRDPTLRASKNEQKQLCHRCEEDMQQNPFGGAPCTGTNTAVFPNKIYGGSIRATIACPTCWDGVNLESAYHKSHVAYPSSGSYESSDPCPSTHPVHLPQVMYEVIWDTRQFNDKSIWPANGSNPMIYSMGDGTGYRWHGDFLFGWKGPVLLAATDERCSGYACKGMKSQTAAQAKACMLSQPHINEAITGWLSSLPGNVPVTYV